MDKDELILQKLEEMEARQRERDAILESRLTKIESEMKEDVKDIRSQLTMVLKDNAELKVNQTKLEGDLHSVDFKLTGKLETLEMKLDNFITNVHERKIDTNERWKVGGIIASCCIAIASLILSILTSLR